MGCGASVNTLSDEFSSRPAITEVRLDRGRFDLTSLQCFVGDTIHVLCDQVYDGLYVVELIQCASTGLDVPLGTPQMAVQGTAIEFHVSKEGDCKFAVFNRGNEQQVRQGSTQALLSVLSVNAFPKHPHRVSVTDDGFFPPLLELSREDTVLFSWVRQKQKHLIRAAIHSNPTIEGKHSGSCAREFASPGIFQLTSTGSNNFVAIVSSTSMTHVVDISKEGDFPSTTCIKQGDSICWKWNAEHYPAPTADGTSSLSYPHNIRFVSPNATQWIPASYPSSIHLTGSEFHKGTHPYMFQQCFTVPGVYYFVLTRLHSPAKRVSADVRRASLANEFEHEPVNLDDPTLRVSEVLKVLVEPRRKVDLIDLDQQTMSPPPIVRVASTTDFAICKSGTVSLAGDTTECKHLVEFALVPLSQDSLAPELHFVKKKTAHPGAYRVVFNPLHELPNPETIVIVERAPKVTHIALGSEPPTTAMRRHNCVGDFIHFSAGAGTAWPTNIIQSGPNVLQDYAPVSHGLGLQSCPIRDMHFFHECVEQGTLNFAAFAYKGDAEKPEFWGAYTVKTTHPERFLLLDEIVTYCTETAVDGALGKSSMFCLDGVEFKVQQSYEESVVFHVAACICTQDSIMAINPPSPHKKLKLTSQPLGLNQTRAPLVCSIGDDIEGRVDLSLVIMDRRQSLRSGQTAEDNVCIEFHFAVEPKGSYSMYRSIQYNQATGFSTPALSLPAGTSLHIDADVDSAPYFTLERYTASTQGVVQLQGASLFPLVTIPIESKYILYTVDEGGSIEHFTRIVATEPTNHPVQSLRLVPEDTRMWCEGAVLHIIHPTKHLQQISITTSGELPKLEIDQKQSADQEVDGDEEQLQEACRKLCTIKLSRDYTMVRAVALLDDYAFQTLLSGPLLLNPDPTPYRTAWHALQCHMNLVAGDGRQPHMVCISLPSDTTRDSVYSAHSRVNLSRSQSLRQGKASPVSPDEIGLSPSLNPSHEHDEDTTDDEHDAQEQTPELAEFLPHSSVKSASLSEIDKGAVCVPLIDPAELFIEIVLETPYEWYLFAKYCVFSTSGNIAIGSSDILFRDEDEDEGERVQDGDSELSDTFSQRFLLSSNLLHDRMTPLVTKVPIVCSTDLQQVSITAEFQPHATSLLDPSQAIELDAVIRRPGFTNIVISNSFMLQSVLCPHVIVNLDDKSLHVFVNAQSETLHSVGRDLSCGLEFQQFTLLCRPSSALSESGSVTIQLECGDNILEPHTLGLLPEVEYTATLVTTVQETDLPAKTVSQYTLSSELDNTITLPVDTMLPPPTLCDAVVYGATAVCTISRTIYTHLKVQNTVLCVQNPANDGMLEVNLALVGEVDDQCYKLSGDVLLDPGVTYNVFYKVIAGAADGAAESTPPSMFVSGATTYTHSPKLPPCTLSISFRESGRGLIRKPSLNVLARHFQFESHVRPDALLAPSTLPIHTSFPGHCLFVYHLQSLTEGALNGVNVRATTSDTWAERTDVTLNAAFASSIMRALEGYDLDLNAATWTEANPWFVDGRGLHRLSKPATVPPSLSTMSTGSEDQHSQEKAPADGEEHDLDEAEVGDPALALLASHISSAAIAAGIATVCKQPLSVIVGTTPPPTEVPALQGYPAAECSGKEMLLVSLGADLTFTNLPMQEQFSLKAIICDPTNTLLPTSITEPREISSIPRHQRPGIEVLKLGYDGCFARVTLPVSEFGPRKVAFAAIPERGESQTQDIDVVFQWEEDGQEIPITCAVPAHTTYADVFVPFTPVNAHSMDGSLADNSPRPPRELCLVCRVAASQGFRSSNWGGNIGITTPTLRLRPSLSLVKSNKLCFHSGALLLTQPALQDLALCEVEAQSWESHTLYKVPSLGEVGEPQPLQSLTIGEAFELFSKEDSVPLEYIQCFIRTSCTFVDTPAPSTPAKASVSQAVVDSQAFLVLSSPPAATPVVNVMPSWFSATLQAVTTPGATELVFWKEGNPSHSTQLELCARILYTKEDLFSRFPANFQSFSFQEPGTVSVSDLEPGTKYQVAVCMEYFGGMIALTALSSFTTASEKQLSVFVSEGETEVTVSWNQLGPPLSPEDFGIYCVRVTRSVSEHVHQQQQCNGQSGASNATTTSDELEFIGFTFEDNLVVNDLSPAEHYALTVQYVVHYKPLPDAIPKSCWYTLDATSDPFNGQKDKAQSWICGAQPFCSSPSSISFYTQGISWPDVSIKGSSVELHGTITPFGLSITNPCLEVMPMLETWTQCGSGDSPRVVKTTKNCLVHSLESLNFKNTVIDVASGTVPCLRLAYALLSVTTVTSETDGNTQTHVLRSPSTPSSSFVDVADPRFCVAQRGKIVKLSVTRFPSILTEAGVAVLSVWVDGSEIQTIEPTVPTVLLVEEIKAHCKPETVDSGRASIMLCVRHCTSGKEIFSDQQTIYLSPHRPKVALELFTLALAEPNPSTSPTFSITDTPIDAEAIARDVQVTVGMLEDLYILIIPQKQRPDDGQSDGSGEQDESQLGMSLFFTTEDGVTTSVALPFVTVDTFPDGHVVKVSIPPTVLGACLIFAGPTLSDSDVRWSNQSSVFVDRGYVEPMVRVVCTEQNTTVPSQGQDDFEHLTSVALLEIQSPNYALCAQPPSHWELDDSDLPRKLPIQDTMLRVPIRDGTEPKLVRLRAVSDDNVFSNWSTPIALCGPAARVLLQASITADKPGIATAKIDLSKLRQYPYLVPKASIPHLRITLSSNAESKASKQVVAEDLVPEAQLTSIVMHSVDAPETSIDVTCTVSFEVPESSAQCMYEIECIVNDTVIGTLASPIPVAVQGDVSSSNVITDGETTPQVDTASPTDAEKFPVSQRAKERDGEKDCEAIEDDQPDSQEQSKADISTVQHDAEPSETEQPQEQQDQNEGAAVVSAEMKQEGPSNTSESEGEDPQLNQVDVAAPTQTPEHEDELEPEAERETIPEPVANSPKSTQSPSTPRTSRQSKQVQRRQQQEKLSPTVPRTPPKPAASSRSSMSFWKSASQGVSVASAEVVDIEQWKSAKQEVLHALSQLQKLGDKLSKVYRRAQKRGDSRPARDIFTSEDSRWQAAAISLQDKYHAHSKRFASHHDGGQQVQVLVQWPRQLFRGVPSLVVQLNGQYLTTVPRQLCEAVIDVPEESIGSRLQVMLLPDEEPGTSSASGSRKVVIPVSTSFCVLPHCCCPVGLAHCSRPDANQHLTTVDALVTYALEKQVTRDSLRSKSTDDLTPLNGAEPDSHGRVHLHTIESLTLFVKCNCRVSKSAVDAVVTVAGTSIPLNIVVIADDPRGCEALLASTAQLATATRCLCPPHAQFLAELHITHAPSLLVTNTRHEVSWMGVISETSTTAMRDAIRSRLKKAMPSASSLVTTSPYSAPVQGTPKRRRAPKP
eukprot:m.6437 g.6437  ORF g.6437 m.6437 type:complete len:3377 (+) comp5159_c0_seq1:73-10203(+)